MIGSFSRIGYAVRRRLFGWTPPPAAPWPGGPSSLTGVTSGLGREAADELAALGARVILAGRDEAKVAAVRDELIARARRGPVPHRRRRHGVARLGPWRRRASPRDRAAARRRSSTTPAPSSRPGRSARTASRRRSRRWSSGRSPSIAGLLPLLDATPGARVISVTSGGQYAQRLHLDDLAVGHGAVGRDAGLRPCQARPGQPDARVGAPDLGRRDSPSSRCTRAGPTRPGSRPRCPASTA